MKVTYNEVFSHSFSEDYSSVVCSKTMNLSIDSKCMSSVDFLDLVVNHEFPYVLVFDKLGVAKVIFEITSNNDLKIKDIP